MKQPYCKVKNLVLGGGIVGQMVNALLPVYVIEKNPAPKKPNQAFGTNYLWEPIPIFDTKEMEIVTQVDGQDATEESIRRYKTKIGKTHEKADEWGLQFQPVTTGHFIVNYPEVDILYGHEVSSIDLKEYDVYINTSDSTLRFKYDRLISTIPLNNLVMLAGMDRKFPVKTIFKYKQVYVKIVPKPLDAPKPDGVIYVNYLSDPLIEPYRYCDRFGERHYESLLPIGFPHKRLYPGKLWKNPLIFTVLEALERENVYCLGRYGRWNPNELLHETYKDLITRIEEWKN